MTRARSLACKQLVELVTAYLEDALRPADRDRVEQHLAACLNCEAYLAQVRLTISLTGTRDAEGGADDPVPDVMLARLLDEFRSPPGVTGEGSTTAPSTDC